MYISYNFNLLFVLCLYFEIEKIVLLEFDHAFFISLQYNYTRYLKLDTRMFLLYFIVLTEHFFENLQLFYSFKVVYVSNVVIIKVESDSCLQEYSVITR